MKAKEFEDVCLRNPPNVRQTTLKPITCEIPNRIEDLSGKRFGKLTVIRYAGMALDHIQRVSLWFCVYDCGNEKLIRHASLRSGNSMSCGCQTTFEIVKATRRRAKSVCMDQEHPLRQLWRSMINRCENPHDHRYYLYGGRGIAVCERWYIFELFIQDIGPRPSTKYQLDRFPNPNGNYEPGNIRWATSKENNRNRRFNHLLSYHGQTRCMAEWAELIAIPWRAIYDRLRYGWSIERTLSEPLRNYPRREHERKTA